MADLGDFTAIQAEFRPQQGHRPEGRGIRVRIRACDDQAPWLRRQDRVLGLQSRILHANGRAGGGDEPHHALRLDGGFDIAAAAGRPHGHHHRFDLGRTFRSQHRLGLAESRVRADGPVAW